MEANTRTTMECCGFGNRGLSFAQLSFANFIHELHLVIHQLEANKTEISKTKKRCNNCRPENINKVRKEYVVLKSKVKTRLVVFENEFKNPYFQKVQLHYPEIGKVLLHYKNKILHSKWVAEL